MSNPTVRRERTAISRTQLSVPARQALNDGLLEGTVLDFGCGRGRDVTALLAAGVDAYGWDPHFRPDPPAGPADTILLTYVVNVIDDESERVRALDAAWALTRRRLVVSARLIADARRLHRPALRGDGVLTLASTFQRFYGSTELKTWLANHLGQRPLAAAPGVLYVFRWPADRIRYLARRHGLAQVNNAGDALDAVTTFLHERGRMPEPLEQPELCTRAEEAGGLARVLAAARTASDSTLVASARSRRSVDLLVVLALERLHGTRRWSDLAPELAADVRAFHGSLQRACRRADWLLWAVGQPDLIRRSVRVSRVGKPTPTALYVHASAAHLIPAPLRVYLACAEAVVGRPPGSNLVKLHHDKPMVSFLTYPQFDRDPHPRLAESVAVDLQRQSATFTTYNPGQNRPLLHRKEEFLTPDDPNRPKLARLTRAEMTAGLYSAPHLIGREDGWNQVLLDCGRTLRGHRLLRTNQG